MKDWILEVTRDKELIQDFEWFPVRKYALYDDGREIEFSDDIHCGEDHWDTQVCQYIYIYFIDD